MSTRIVSWSPSTFGAQEVRKLVDQAGDHRGILAVLGCDMFPGIQPGAGHPEIEGLGGEVVFRADDELEGQVVVRRDARGHPLQALAQCQAGDLARVAEELGRNRPLWHLLENRPLGLGIAQELPQHPALVVRGQQECPDLGPCNCVEGRFRNRPRPPVKIAQPLGAALAPKINPPSPSSMPCMVNG